MKSKLYLFLALFAVVVVFSCKKDTPRPQQQPPQQQTHTLESGLLDFSISGELLSAAIDTTLNTITVVVPDTANQQKLRVTLTLASQVTATLNNIAFNSTGVYDFTQPVVVTVSSADRQRSTTFQVIVQTELQYFGFTGNIVADKSLGKSYNFYLDQFDGSKFQSVNCGPTVTTMAIKWADSTFTKTPVYARSVYHPTGGWWYTDDVQAYLSLNNIHNSVDTLQNIDSLVKANIDNNNLLIICLDMFYVPLNGTDYQHVSKFYPTNATGWGHFLLAKGYRQVGTDFYLEIYDPYSDGRRYSGLDNFQLKGKDRYYLDRDIYRAAGVWWPYVIIVEQGNKNTPTPAMFQLNRISHKKPIPVAGGR